MGKMNLIQSIIFGLISGLTEFLPVSSQGHQAVLKTLFGENSPDPFRSLLIHIGILLAIIISCGTYLERLRRDYRMRNRSSRRTAQHLDRKTAYDLRFLKTAAVPMLLCMILYGFTRQLNGNLAFVALFFAINGILVYIPEHLPQSNKDASRMSSLDSFLVGIGSAAAIFPGISRVGVGYSCAIAQGADREKALNWVLVLSIPALILMSVFDIIELITFGFGAVSPVIIVGMILSAIMAFLSACAGIFLMRFLTVRSGVTAFGFYCWGAALLSLILFLTA